MMAAPRLLRRSLLAAALVAVAGLAAAQGLGSRFDPRRDAAADVAQAIDRARAEGKRVIVDVGGEWCTWCHILERFIASNEEVRALVAAEFVWVKVNVSPANRNEAVLSAWPKITGYPHLFVLDGTGRLVRSQPTAAFEAGNSYNKAKLLAFLRESRGVR